MAYVIESVSEADDSHDKTVTTTIAYETSAFDHGKTAWGGKVTLYSKGLTNAAREALTIVDALNGLKE